MSSTKSATSQIEPIADTPQSQFDQQGNLRDAGSTVTGEIRAKPLAMCCKKENVLLLQRIKDLTYTIQVQKELITQLSCHSNNNYKMSLPANSDNHSEPASQLTDPTTTQTRLKWNNSFATAKSMKNTKKNKILILADSHGRNLSTLLGAEEDTSTVTSIIKPNGLMVNVLEKSKELCTDLTKNDHLIIHAGTNNIPHDPFKIISTLLLALPPLSHTNIVIITIPVRLSSTLTCINKLTSIINKHLRFLPHFFPHVRIVEAEDLGKNPSTSSGIHLTGRGKVMLCERIKTNIRTFTAKNQATAMATNNILSSPPFPTRRLPPREQTPSSSDVQTRTRTTDDNSRETVLNSTTPLPTMTATKNRSNATRVIHAPARTAANEKNRGQPSSPALPPTVIITKITTATQNPHTPKIIATTPFPTPTPRTAPVTNSPTRQTPNATKTTPLPAPTPKTTHTTSTTPCQTPKYTATRFPPSRASKKNHKPIPPNRPFPPTKSSRIKQ